MTNGGDGGHNSPSLLGATLDLGGKSGEIEGRGEAVSVFLMSSDERKQGGFEGVLEGE